MKLSHWLWFSITLGLLGCSAPHDNPLDPKSSHYHGSDPDTPADSLVARAWSWHVSYGSLGESFNLSVELTDFDGNDGDSAWVTMDGQSSRALSRSSSDPRVWATTYSGTSDYVSSFIGLPMAFLSQDSSGRESRVGPVYLFRVISATPLLLGPDHDSTVTAHPRLSWQVFTAGYPFMFQTVIFDSIGDVLWNPPDLPSGVTDITVSDSLAPGFYSWTVTVVDNLGNTSRSKMGNFRVE